LTLTLEEARKKFPFLSTDTYLDNASASLSFDGMDAAAGRFYREHKSLGITAREGWRSVASACRIRIAQLINVKPSEILFLSNTSEGINMVANIIDWRPGDEVLIADNEFPGNIYPWTRLKNRGVQVRVVRSEGGNLPPEVYSKCITTRTRLISVSHVNWASGFRVSLEEMRAITKDKGILLCVDACQSLCAVPVDAQFADFVSASVFKWPLGPFGLSVFYISERLAEKFQPNYVSYASIKDELGITFEAPELREGSQKFQYAHINYPGVYALSGALELLDAIGIEMVYKRVAQLVQYLIDGLDDRGISNLTPKEADHRGGIVSVQVGEAERLMKTLKEAKIHVTLRNNRLRVSPHFYNNESDIRKFLEVVGTAIHDSPPCST
jgi:cysteine desulfurase / selenocysteine lyase